MARTAATITAQPLVRPENPPARRSLPAAVLGFFGNLLFGIVLLAVCAIFLGLTVLPRFVQFQPYVVLTGSMTPAIPVGSIVIAMPVDPKDIKVGDVISFTRAEEGREPITITHRVAEVVEPESRFPAFITKGDANPVRDADPVRYLGPAGKVVGWVPHIGQFFLFGRTQQGKTLLLMVPGVLLAVSLLWTIWKPSKPASGPAPATAEPLAAPDPQTPFAVEVLARAYALLGDPALTVEQRFSGLQPLIKRAERAGDAGLARWLESRVTALISDSTGSPAVTAAVVPVPAAPPTSTLRSALRRTGARSLKIPAAAGNQEGAQ